MLNPLAAADLPAFRALADGARPVLDGDGGFGAAGTLGFARAIDANLSVDGRPQSGTGQTALLTGVNAPALYGRHFGPWVPTGLQPLLARENLFQRTFEAGVEPVFANCAPGGAAGARARSARRPGAFPFAALSAGVAVRDELALREGRGLVSSITTDAWRRHLDPAAPVHSPADAGRILSRVSRESRLSVFAHYDTDYVGHRGDMGDALEVITRVDRFLEGLLGDLDADTLLVITSDHGNLEDMTTGHTRNPVPLFASGPGGESVCARVESLIDLAPLLLELVADDGA